MRAAPRSSAAPSCSSRTLDRPAQEVGLESGETGAESDGANEAEHALSPEDEGESLGA
jgi:hypothetical protein